MHLSRYAIPAGRHGAMRTGLVVTVDYAAVRIAQRLLARHEAEIEGETYGADVAYRLRLPRERVASFTAELLDLTRGRAAIEAVDGEAGDDGVA